ncbi:MAG TPA: bifunctional (p)ppGpp synthetase/guanosine-3',5'-bis(diphosphate) 3'-pyrophosphohydrolase [bacterium]|nr:bifunctional (p)ppGpp synthetase/guanosine-3',5'-bis(diphosphate) 3'-pyrophosphohydrolase [bacterium]
MIRLEDILEEVHRYNPDSDLDLIKKAYVFSAKVHQGQTRRSGEPYLVHPLEVSHILAQMRLDAPSIATGLLHDTVEDTLTTVDEVQQIFGKPIARLVDGVTKLSKISFTSKEQRQAENFRKMFMAMAEDIRVILVKLADRLHNMRTLQHLSEEKQVRIAQETLDIYAPIAGRLGMQEVRIELENLCLKYLKPEVYRKLSEKVEEMEKKSGRFMDDIRESLAKKMGEYGLKAEIQARTKHLYSIYKKMEDQKIEFEQIYDLIAFRVIVQTLPQCYETLGFIHSLWKPVPGRFKDYIGMPKVNNYQSLHTTVIVPRGQRVEFQIRTKDMHQIAEWGIASHWRYKESGEIDMKDEAKFRWVRQFLEWQKELSDPAEYLDTVKLDLFATDVYVFTPKGDIRELPTGSTPIDFAYAIHTEVGHHCVGARVNGKMVPLRYQLKSGDTVEVMTNAEHRPSKDWLKHVQTSRAKAKIRQFIREEQREKAVSLGKELVERELEKYGLKESKILAGDAYEAFLQDKGVKNQEHLFAMMGYGRISAQQLLTAVLPKEKLEELANAQPKATSAIGRIFQKAFDKSAGVVKVGGYDDMLVSLAKCCNPIPGDSIIGFITRGRGVTIHSSNCSKVLASDQARRVEASWNLKTKMPTATKIRVVCVDKPGLLADISQSISAEGVNISEATCRAIGDQKSMNTFEVGIKDLKHLHQLMKSLEKVKGVISVERVRD